MSFSSETKEELIGLEQAQLCCRKAELSAVLRLAGALSPGSAGMEIRIQTESAIAQRYVLKLMKSMYQDAETKVFVRENQHLKKRRTFILVLFGARIKDVLKDAGFGAHENILQWNTNKIKKQCCRKSFLRACFILSGSVSNPVKAYRIELVVKDDELVQLICTMIQHLGMNCRVIQRKGSHVVYLKDGESISDFLAHTGASHAVLELENIRVLKEVRNNVNRAVNCETANYDKTTYAAQRQIENIQYIKDNMGLKKLPQKLMILAEMRLNYPDASLQDLADMLSEQVGRSGINHRLRKLNQIAEELRIKKGEG
ncbi:MAG: DNA-binding protein WhiA [Christensenellales bacterium]